MSPRARKQKLETVKTRGGRMIPVDHLHGLVAKANENQKSVLTFVSEWCHLAIEDAAHVLRDAGLR